MQRAKPRRGEIWFIYTPGQPGDPHQPRPGLIISGDSRNRHSDDFIVVPIFSAGAPGPTRVIIRAGSGGLPRDSILFCEELTTVDQEFLDDGPLGPAVDAQLLERTVRAIRRAVGEVVPEP